MRRAFFVYPRSGADARAKMLKSGAWPSLTKPVQFVTSENVPPDFQDITTGDGKALSMMRNLIDTDTILRKIKK
jgi:hypothetical protein